MGKIVLATDFSPAAAKAYAPAIELARRLDHGIVLLHALSLVRVPPPRGAVVPPAYPDVTAQAKDARARLDEIKRTLGDAVPIEADVVQGEAVAATIASYAERIGAAFIALATHGRTGFRHLILGSVAEAVLRHARTPVVCFPAG